MNLPSNNSANAWSNYWTKGFLTTFVDAEHENYSGKVKAHWEQAFAQVPNGGTIVDLGAGNGAILALAKEALSNNEREMHLVAVDFADIANTSEFYKENPEIEIRGKTSIENTGLATNSVDLCTSQFGFEYANTTMAARELSRILNPTGKFEAIMHHGSSAVALHSRSALEQVTLCNRSKLTETTVKLLRRLQKLKKSHRSAVDDIKATELRDHFNNMANRLNKYADDLYNTDHVRYFLNELGSLFSKRAKDLTFDKKIEIVKQLEIDSAEYNQRMLSMLDASSDQQKIEEITNTLVEEGLHVVAIEELAQDNQKFAWIVSAVKHK